MFHDMLSAFNTWYDSDKLSKQRKGIYVWTTNNYNGKKIVKFWTCQFEKMAIQTGKNS